MPGLDNKCCKTSPSRISNDHGTSRPSALPAASVGEVLTGLCSWSVMELEGSLTR